MFDDYYSPFGDTLQRFGAKWTKKTKNAMRRPEGRRRGGYENVSDGGFFTDLSWFSGRIDRQALGNLGCHPVAKA